MNNHFFALLRASLGLPIEDVLLSGQTDWQSVFGVAKKQTLVGVCFAGVERLPKEVLPPKTLLLQWFAVAEQTRRRNLLVTNTVGKVRSHFQDNGMTMVLLKGQGNGIYYRGDVHKNDRLALLRTPGDIDSWVFPKEIVDEDLESRLNNDHRVLKWLWRHDSSRRHCYIHTDYPDFDGVAVEMHFRPSYLNSPIRNMRLQRWFANEMKAQSRNEVVLPGSEVKVCIPTVYFNIIYQLTHLYRHLFDDGIGLRQVVDYYFLLKARNNDVNDNYTESLREFGMLKFAGALMYVMQEIFHLEDERMICPVDAKRGANLIQEIMSSGNFGQYENRGIRFKYNNGVTRFLRRQIRNMRFMFDYPEDVLSVPVYRAYQEIWRRVMVIKHKK